VVWKFGIFCCVFSLLEGIKKLVMYFFKQQRFWTLVFVDTISQVLVIGMESQISLVLFLDVSAVL
jgi:hypothetical protein